MQFNHFFISGFHIFKYINLSKDYFNATLLASTLKLIFYFHEKVYSKNAPFQSEQKHFHIKINTFT